MIKTLRVSEKGQIVIPQIIREQMGIQQGDELVLLQIEGRILLEKAQKTEEKLKGNFKDILSFSEQSLREVWDNEEDEIWSQYLK